METAVAQQGIEEVSCVLIPQQAASLLLPNVSVAEILPWRRVKPLAHVPDWCLGALGWRGETVPVIRYERLAHGSSQVHSAAAAGRCIVVMNRCSSSSGPAFYAIAAEGLPRMLQLADDDLEAVPEAEAAAGGLNARLGTESVIIPDLDFIETEVRKIGLH